MRFSAGNFTARGVIFAVWTTECRSPESATVRAARLTGGALPYRAGLAVEDCGFMAEAGFGTLDLPQLKYCSLTWNYDNAFAGGADGTGRLTQAGRRLIDSICSHGVAVDTAHLNEKSFYDVIDYCGGRARIINSHTALARLMKHPRNLTDGQVKAIIRAGGIIGLAAVRAFLNRDDADVKAYASHIVEYVETFGAESLAVGTDFYGTAPLDGLESYSKFTEVRELLNRSLTSKQIDAVFYGNAEKFFYGS